MKCRLLVLVFLLAAPLLRSQEAPADYQEVLKYLSKQGDYKANVLKVNIPRNDLKVTIQGAPIPTPFGFGGWIAFTKGTGGMDVMMGDLVLTESEVNPVMSALLDNGLEVTALHNHFFYEEPRIFYMHVHGHGKAMDLAHQVRPALLEIGKDKSAAGKSSGGAPAPLTQDTISKINSIVGHEGETAGPVYKITIGRDDLNLKEMGATINARMGLNTWAAFVTIPEGTAIAGDIAMLGNEVTPVLKALRKGGVQVVAIHHHMIGTQPPIYFLHYWGTGTPDSLAATFRAALDQLGKHGPPAVKKHTM